MNSKSKLVMLVLLSSTFSFLFASTAVAGTKILVFGDFGTGEENQKVVARDMVKFCASNTCDFGVTVGDNIYPRGIENFSNGQLDYFTGTPNWPNVKKIFVDNYKDLNIPIYMTYGNHDVGNDGVEHVFRDMFKQSSELNQRIVQLMLNQVQFTNHEMNPVVSANPPARLWTFPAPFYKVQRNDVSMFSIDTNSYPHAVLDKNFKLHVDNEKNFEQEKWLSAQLSKPHDGWKIVFGHVPLFSHGRHAWLDSWVIKDFRAAILQTLCKNKVDFYLSGHDHHMEIDQHKCDNGHVLTAILSGAAAKQTRVYQRTFDIFSADKNLLWANGKHYDGHKSIYSDDLILGFSYIDIKDDKTAQVRMKLSQGTSREHDDGCFLVTKGQSVKKVQCLYD